MSMDFGLKRKLAKRSKSYIKTIGIRSINDIINDENSLSFVAKVNYIRHHYTYYDGCYEYFHNENGKPNNNKYLLNEIISNIIQKKLDPSELKHINKKMLAWKKEHDKQVAEKQEEELQKVTVSVSEYDGMNWYKFIKNNIGTAGPYITLIKKYLECNKDVIKPQILETISYQDLKAIALRWDKNQTLIDASSLYKAKTLEEFLAILENRSGNGVYFPLIKLYLAANDNNIDLETLKGKKYKNLKNISLNWAISKRINNEQFDFDNLPEPLKNIIDERVEKFKKREEEEILVKMKKYAEDLGYKKDVVNE